MMKGVMVWRHVPELYAPFEDSRDAGIKAGQQRMGKECRSKFIESVPLLLDRAHHTLDKVIGEFNVPAPPDDEWERAVQVRSAGAALIISRVGLLALEGPGRPEETRSGHCHG